MGGSVGQRFNMENNPELFFNTEAGKAEADKNFFDSLRDLSGGIVNFGKDIAGRTLLSTALQGAGTVIGGPVVGTIAGITGLMKGGNLFNAPYIGADSSITGTPLAQYAFRDQLRRDPNFDIGAALDKQNALGGYYSDFARQQRSMANRYSKLLDKAYSGTINPAASRNLLRLSNALGFGMDQKDLSNIVSGAYNITPGTFTAESLSQGFDSEEGPVGGGGGLGSFDGGTGTMSASDFSDDTAGTPF